MRNMQTKREQCTETNELSNHVQIYNQGIKSYESYHLGFQNLESAIDMKPQEQCMV